MAFRRFVALLVVLSAPALFADAPGVYAITGGTVHPASGAAIAKGTVVIRNGLIESVGANVSVPADATVIDAANMHVYPGLIDAQTSLGISTPKAEGRNRPAEPTPDAMAIRAVNISDDDADARRATGVTTVLTAPSYGIFNGQSAIVNLGSGPIESSVIKSPAALQIAFATRPTWTYPDSLMGVMAVSRSSTRSSTPRRARSTNAIRAV